MTEKQKVKNEYGIDIVVCCASCANKDIRNNHERTCRPVNKPTHPSEFCKSWRMAEHLKNAGRGGGRVKKKAWIDYVKDNGRTDQAQRDFERANGSIYLSNK